MRCLFKDGSTVGFDIWVPTTAVGYSHSSVSKPVDCWRMLDTENDVRSMFYQVGKFVERKQTKFSANVPTLKYLPGLTTAYIGQIGKFFMGYFSVDFKYCL